MNVLFSDGAAAWQAGPLHLVCLDDMWHVVGHGYLCQVDTKEEGMALIRKLSGPKEADDSADAEFNR